MDLIMTMFKSSPKVSMSPVKLTNSSSKKRPHEPSPTRASNGTSGTGGRPSKSIKIDETRFSFEQVKGMLDALLALDKKKLDHPIKTGFRYIDFDQVAVPGRSAKTCQDLVDKLVSRTRRVRTTNEVLQEIRDNLSKRQYTDIILRSSLGREPPKRPPSAYLLFHQDKYNELKHEIQKASEIAKIVSDEWKNLDSRRRAAYQKRHDDLVRKYEKDIKRLGLVKLKKPRRPKTARTLYVQSKLAELEDSLDKEKLASLKREFEEEYDNADQYSKEPWIELAKEKQAQFLEESIEYMEANQHLDPKDTKIRQKKIKLKPPTAPRNPVRIYIDKKMPEGLMGQELKETELRWRDKFARMSSKKQVRYIKKAIKEKEQYDIDIAEFSSEHPEYILPKLKPNITQAQWKLYQSEVENKPIMPAQSAYLHYCSKNILESTDEDAVPTARLQAASAAWCSLSEDEKKEVYEEHVNQIKQYIADMEAWLEEQDEQRIERVFREDPKTKPEFWRRRLAKLEKMLAKTK